MCFAQQLYFGDVHEITWDLEPLPPFDVTQMYEYCAIDRAGGGSPVDIHEVDLPPVDFNVSCYDFIATFGVRTVWVLGEDVIIDDTLHPAGSRIVSEWNFSDVDGESTPDPFECYRGVHAPIGVKRTN